GAGHVRLWPALGHRVARAVGGVGRVSSRLRSSRRWRAEADSPLTRKARGPVIRRVAAEEVGILVVDARAEARRRRASSGRRGSGAMRGNNVVAGHSAAPEITHHAFHGGWFPAGDTSNRRRG